MNGLVALFEDLKEQGWIDDAFFQCVIAMERNCICSVIGGFLQMSGAYFVFIERIIKPPLDFMSLTIYAQKLVKLAQIIGFPLFAQACNKFLLACEDEDFDRCSIAFVTFRAEYKLLCKNLHQILQHFEIHASIEDPERELIVAHDDVVAPPGIALPGVAQPGIAPPGIHDSIEDPERDLTVAREEAIVPPDIPDTDTSGCETASSSLTPSHFTALDDDDEGGSARRRHKMLPSRMVCLILVVFFGLKARRRT